MNLLAVATNISFISCRQKLMNQHHFFYTAHHIKSQGLVLLDNDQRLCYRALLLRIKQQTHSLAQSFHHFLCVAKSNLIFFHSRCGLHCDKTPPLRGEASSSLNIVNKG